MSDDPTTKLWAQAVEEHIAGLSDNDFQAMVDRTRPPRISDMSHRELLDHIARKSITSREMTRARANGGGPTITN
jgi:hypothetical protein